MRVSKSPETPTFKKEKGKRSSVSSRTKEARICVFWTVFLVESQMSGKEKILYASLR